MADRQLSQGTDRHHGQQQLCIYFKMWKEHIKNCTSKFNSYNTLTSLRNSNLSDVLMSD